MTPRVSVVMAAYQAETTVGAAVESVLWQRYPNFELIVVDDGSTDATASIVAAHKGPLRLVQQGNAGVGAARNRGIAEAKGELITFCDADALAAAIARVLSSPKLAARLARAGRLLAAEHGEDAMVRAFLDVYERRAA